MDDAEITLTGNSLTIDPGVNLPDSVTLYVVISSGAIKGSSLDFSGLASKNLWKFSMVDLVGPTLVNLSPIDNTSSVLENTNLTIEFDETIQAGSIATSTDTLFIKKVSDDSTVVAYSLDDSEVSITSKTLTVNPSSNLPTSTALYLEVTAGSVMDAASNDFLGLTGNTLWNFTTGDSVAPIIAVLTPLDDAVAVSNAQTMTLQFDESIQIGSIAGSVDTIFIKKVSDNNIVFQYSIDDAQVSIAGDTLTVNPSTDLSNNEHLYLEITSGALSDTSSNDFTGISGTSVWDFYTVDSAAPMISTLTPLDNASAIVETANLSIEFDENIFAGSVATSSTTIFVKKVSDGSTLFSYSLDDPEVTLSGKILTINPGSNLPSSTDLYIAIASGALDDSSANDFTGFLGNSTWNFTTSDTFGPILSKRIIHSMEQLG